MVPTWRVDLPPEASAMPGPLRRLSLIAVTPSTFAIAGCGSESTSLRSCSSGCPREYAWLRPADDEPRYTITDARRDLCARWRAERALFGHEVA